MKKLFTAFVLLALAAPALPCEGMKPTNADTTTSKTTVASSKGTVKKSQPKSKALPTAKPAAVTN
jgi:hypothetical protein